MRRMIAAAALVVVLAFAASVHAAGPRRFGHRAHTPNYSKHAEIAAYGKAVYPKYYKGFHAREFQNLGVPHGDIGLRGNDLNMGAW
jgi:hypothetical protein